jgi:hypothetical protein
MLRSTTRSTFNATSSPAALFGPSGPRRHKLGRLQPLRPDRARHPSHCRLAPVPVTVPDSTLLPQDGLDLSRDEVLVLNHEDAATSQEIPRPKAEGKRNTLRDLCETRAQRTHARANPDPPRSFRRQNGAAALIAWLVPNPQDARDCVIYRVQHPPARQCDCRRGGAADRARD